MTTLLQGGTLLVHDEQLQVQAVKSDLLIQDGSIVKIAESIKAPAGATVLDCTDKLISPGFVDTHHHVWQSALKGKHGDHTLLEYFPTGLLPGVVHTPNDIFWGQLSGALEALDSGTTTVVDHAHLTITPEHAYAAMHATILSGLRSFFCYTPTLFAESWSPFKLSSPASPWIMETYDKLAAAAPFASERVQLGFAFDALFLPKEMLQPLFQKLHRSAKVITHHATASPMAAHSPLRSLLDKDLLGGSSKTILSHENNVPASNIPDLAKYRVNISTTPTTELSMGMGNPVPIALRQPEFDEHFSLGIDCHSAVSSFMPEQARQMILAARAHKHAEAWNEGKWHRRMTSTEKGRDFPTTRRAFNMLTVGGARAVGLEQSIGQLKVGFKADVVVWDALSPGMVSAAQQDPVSAVVWHSSPRDVAGVLVDGVVRKWDGKLVDVAVDAQSVPAPLDAYKVPVGAGTKALAWKDVAAHMVRTRAEVAKKMEAVPAAQADIEDGVLAAWHMNTAAMIE